MPVDDYTPEVQDVADHLSARTRDKNGAEAGTFNSDTRPTDEQVERLITKAAGTVSLRIGDDIPAALFEEAQDVVALRAAMLVELDFYPEQVSSDRSPYAELKELYDEQIGTQKDPGSLVLAVRNALSDSTVDVSGSNRPSASFPKAPKLTW